MFCHGRLILSVAVLMGAITSSVCIAGDRVRPLVPLTGQGALRPSETTITSGRARDAVITITNADGRLRGGDNDFCVVFEKKETREPINVQNVSVDFILLVGKIEEQPIRVRLPEVQRGRFCGHANLGKQYYVPASYYAFVLYTDTGQKKRKERLFLSVK